MNIKVSSISGTVGMNAVLKNSISGTQFKGSFYNLSFTPNIQIPNPSFTNPNQTFATPYGDRSVTLQYDRDRSTSTQQEGKLITHTVGINSSLGFLQGIGVIPTDFRSSSTNPNQSGLLSGQFGGLSTQPPSLTTPFNYGAGKNLSFGAFYRMEQTNLGTLGRFEYNGNLSLYKLNAK